MTAPARDVAAATSVLSRCPEVELLGLIVHLESIIAAGPMPDVITLDTHVYGWRDAERLAAALTLPPVEGYEMAGQAIDGQPGWWEYRCWVGWVADASMDRPVSVKVVAGEFFQAVDPDDLLHVDALIANRQAV